MKNLKLERPLVSIDTETTGVDVDRDRIVEIGMVKCHPNGKVTSLVLRVNPTITIPQGATAVHGIHDEDVKDCPKFSEVAQEILDFVDGCDLAGFNLAGFDIPLINRELKDCHFQPLGHKTIDVLAIYHHKEKRDLSRAVRVYLNREHDGAHGAEADASVVLEILDEQIRRYDLPRDIDVLSNINRYNNVDDTGRFVWRNDKAICNFKLPSKRDRTKTNKGIPIDEIPKEDLIFILEKDFPQDVKDIAINALKDEYPKRFILESV